MGRGSWSWVTLHALGLNHWLHRGFTMFAQRTYALLLINLCTRKPLLFLVNCLLNLSSLCKKCSISKNQGGAWR